MVQGYRKQLLPQLRGFIQTCLENVFPTQLSLACQEMFCIKSQYEERPVELVKHSMQVGAGGVGDRNYLPN